MANFPLPFGVYVLNPVLLDPKEGPYTHANEAGAIALANTGVPIGIRSQGQMATLIIAGVSKKYIWQNGNADTDLLPLSPDLSGKADKLTVINATDSAYTLPKPALLFLPVNIANRILTLPDAATTTGIMFPVCNQNTSAFKWSFAGNVYDATGTAITDMANGTTYLLVSYGTAYLLIQSGASIPVNNKFPYTLPFNLS